MHNIGKEGCWQTEHTPPTSLLQLSLGRKGGRKEQGEGEGKGREGEGEVKGRGGEGREGRGREGREGKGRGGEGKADKRGRSHVAVHALLCSYPCAHPQVMLTLHCSSSLASFLCFCSCNLASSSSSLYWEERERREVGREGEERGREEGGE